MAKPARHPAATLMQVRHVHTWIGMLIAPTVIFMAATGLIQIFSLHEAHDGYTPPPLIERLGSVHKDQRFTLGHHGGPKAGHKPGAEADADHGSAPAAPTPPANMSVLAMYLLKWVFALVAVGLMVSTCLGVWMSLRQGPRRRTWIILLAVGTVVPVVLAALTG